MKHRPNQFTLTAAPIVATLMAGALFAAPAVTRADDTQAGTTYVCRPSATDETPNAKMMAATNTALVCRPVELTLHMSGGNLRTIGQTTAKPANVVTGPDLSKALTPQQINDAYVRFIEQTFHIDHTS
jgi:hypothetical protein